MQDFVTDELGRNWSTRLLTDPTFEKRLKTIDPTLKLIFDQTKQRWMILAPRIDNPYLWRIIKVAEDKLGNPMPVGDWLLLEVRRLKDQAERRDHNPDQFIKWLEYEEGYQQERIQSKRDADFADYLREDRVFLDKAYRQFMGMPVSDATAGYAKG